MQNPCESLNLERKVKEWEWRCNKYSVAESNASEPSDSILDEKILQSLSKEYFNTEQKNLLNELLSVGKLQTQGRAAVVAGQINSISDFYLGRKVLETSNETISITNSLIATIRQLVKQRKEW